MDNKFYGQSPLYLAAVVFSVLFALVGFTYNVWRMEASEHNNNVRTACFEMLINLSALEQLIYAAHYDNNAEEGNPRKGWVTVGLLEDLSVLANPQVRDRSTQLKAVWSDHWHTMAAENDSVELLVDAIDSVRAEIKTLLISLE